MRPRMHALLDELLVLSVAVALAATMSPAFAASVLALIQ